MATDNKILTVSYGTFSCTLEGFDDPFNTMRSIAEYFRDLASEDRYFGAEPPTPDPQMLQSIAEREIERRVETQMGEKGMILRQTREEAPATAPTTADDNTTAPETSQETAPQTDVALAQTPVVDSAPATETPALATPTDAPSGSIAEKLARIRAAVANREDAPFAEDQRAEAFAAPITQAPEAAEDDIEEEDAPADVIAMDHTVEKEAIAKDAENITTPDEAVHDETGRDTDEEIVAQDVAEISESDEIAVAPDALPDTDEPDDAEIPQHDMDPNLAADIAEASAEAESEDTLDDPLSRVRPVCRK